MHRQMIKDEAADGGSVGDDDAAAVSCCDRVDGRQPVGCGPRMRSED